MKYGIVFRPGNLWIGAHWSPQNNRLCVTPFPMITVWVTFKGGLTPRQSAARQRWADRLYRDLNCPRPRSPKAREIKINLIDDPSPEILAWAEKIRSERRPPDPNDPTTS